MGKVLAYILFGSTMLVALPQPWVGVLGAYTFVLMQPHVLWPWVFEGIRHFMILAIPTIIGCSMLVLSGRAKLFLLKTRLNLFFLLWWVFSANSYFLGPYVGGGPGPRNFDPDLVIVSMCKSFVFYFIAVICIDSDKKLRYLVYVLLACVAVLVHWANEQYLTGQVFGRLMGPGDNDENVFAAIFVMGLPFFWYAGLYFKRLLIRGALWLVIPFGWHAVFLTGSRGALLGIGATLLVMSLRSRRARLGLLLIPLFAAAYVWQAGGTMKERVTTISEYETESSAMGRINAWITASRMMMDHPITGVGLASFGSAYPDYSDTKPRVAHNTFFQISGESGVIAGSSWLLILLTSILALWRQVPPPTSTLERDSHAQFAVLMRDAVLASLVGYGVCAAFLSLQGVETFFFLGILTNYLIHRRGREVSTTAAIDTLRPRGSVGSPTSTKLMATPRDR